MNIRIRQVRNGFIVCSAPSTQHGVSGDDFTYSFGDEFVFNTLDDLFTHIRGCVRDESRVNLGKEKENV